MPSAFTIDTESECCCPEMRCCTPEIVYAVVSGIQGASLHPGDGVWGDPTTFAFGACGSITNSMGEEYFYEGWNKTVWYASNFSGFGAGFDTRLNLSKYPLMSVCAYTLAIELSGGEAKAVYNYGADTDKCDPWGDGGNSVLRPFVREPFNWGVSGSPWNAWCFTPSVPSVTTCDASYGTVGRQFGCVHWCGGDGPTDSVAVAPWLVSFSPLPAGHLCYTFPYACQKPPDGYHGGRRAGPEGVIVSHIRVYEPDLNGKQYVCTRPDITLRPELRAKINRPSGRVPAGAHGIHDAQLLFEVYKRRSWQVHPKCSWDIKAFAGVKDDLFGLGASDEYCVDYRCTPRAPWFQAENEEDLACGRGQCSVPRGCVEPHLRAYSEGGNVTADIQVRTVPYDGFQGYEGDDLLVSATDESTGLSARGRFPVYRVVGEINVLDGGSGYAVGDFFRCDFDWIDFPQLGGEVYGIFENWEKSCGPQYTYTYRDKYGYEGEDFGVKDEFDRPVKTPIQRLRVSAVDENGAITGLEVVPWYRNPERYTETCERVESNDVPEAERAEYFARYTRVLCHPVSVHYGGTGYEIGDEITFECDDPDCEVVEAATAVVSDVDAEGAILDWFISGSDSWITYDPGSCDPDPSLSGPCCGFYQDDERGIYKRTGKNLCSLTWQGVGAPVRVQVDCGCPSALTTVTVTIVREQCETALEVSAGNYPYGIVLEYITQTREVMAKRLWKPYPKFQGGGAVIEPVFGSWGDNESVFGSRISGTTIHSRGAGYAFRDKRHLSPILPSEVPDLGESDPKPVSVGPMTATLALWSANVGDSVSAGQVVAIIAVDGPSGERQAPIVAPVTGVLSSRSFTPGETVFGGQIIGAINSADPTQGEVSIRLGNLSQTLQEWKVPVGGCVAQGQEVAVVFAQYPDGQSEELSVYSESRGTLVSQLRDPGQLIASEGQIATIEAGIGQGAVLSFAFSAVRNFPNPQLAYPTWADGNFQIDQDRFSYFPVVGVSILAGGCGYSVGQEFDVSPAGGKAFDGAWENGGGDDPDACPNGGWYAGDRATVNEAGYFSLVQAQCEPWDQSCSDSTPGEDVFQKNPVCRLRISSVNNFGSITGIQIIHGGMMFRSTWTSGRKHPDILPTVSSVLGYGAKVAATFNTDHQSPLYGTLTTFSIVPSNEPDPLHSTPGNTVAMPTGGRDYADPGAGWFWRLLDIEVGGGALFTTWKLMAYAPWCVTRLIDGTQPHSAFWYNALHPSDPRWSTHDIAAGSAPPFEPPSSVCYFPPDGSPSDCYHPLLNRTYKLYKVWGGSGDMAPILPGSIMEPTTPWGMFKPRDKPYVPCYWARSPLSLEPGEVGARGAEMIVAEWGPTITLSYTASSPCPDHTNGSTYAIRRVPPLNTGSGRLGRKYPGIDYYHGVYPNTDFE